MTMGPFDNSASLAAREKEIAKGIAEHSSRVRDFIVQHSSQLTSELNGYISDGPPDHAVFVYFQIHMDEIRCKEDSAISAWAADRDNVCGSFTENDRTLLDGVAIVSPILEERVDDWEVLLRCLAPWFGECWLATGGGNFPIPAMFCQHDDNKWYDLRHQNWVDLPLPVDPSTGCWIPSSESSHEG